MDTDTIFAADQQADIGTNEMTQEDWEHFTREMYELDPWGDDGKTPAERAAEMGESVPF